MFNKSIRKEKLLKFKETTDLLEKIVEDSPRLWRKIKDTNPENEEVREVKRILEDYFESRPNFLRDKLDKLKKETRRLGNPVRYFITNDSTYIFGGESSLDFFSYDKEMYSLAKKYIERNSFEEKSHKAKAS